MTYNRPWFAPKILFNIAIIFSLTLLLSGFNPVLANKGGEVHVPLNHYLDTIRAGEKKPKMAPAGFAMGSAVIAVTVYEREEHVGAIIEADFSIQILENEWTTVPILPVSSVLSETLVNQKRTPLIQGADYYSWASAIAGTYNVHLRYVIDAYRSDDGYIIALPLPPVPSSKLTVTIPRSKLAASILPAVGMQIQKENNKTVISAEIASVAGVQIAWQMATEKGYAITRADYRGELKNTAIVWNAKFAVEVFKQGLLKLPLFPQHVTLHDIRVDDSEAVIVTEDGFFAILVESPGNHKIDVRFAVPIKQGKDQPGADVPIPEVAISSFILSLPGKKEVRVEPNASITTEFGSDVTQASFFMPMAKQIAFFWSEAVPENAVEELRANANLFHTLYAEEGVLHGSVVAAYEITRGKSNTWEMSFPQTIQITRIQSEKNTVSDWRVSTNTEGERSLTVFFDRKIKENFTFTIIYELLLNAVKSDLTKIQVPLLRAIGVHRQRGMVALLSGQELALKPIKAERVSKVGENQLPSFVRENLSMTVAHTYKYVDSNPLLMVETVVPEKKLGRYDAQIDTLISIGDVSMRGIATIAVSIKAGGIMGLALALPKEINVLGLTGPSIRTYTVQTNDHDQLFTIAFTREMEGQFRLELHYEKLLSDNVTDITIPTATVIGSEVEYGRIAIEALTAVEVQTATAERISSLDRNELPKQLVLKTSNPILLAFRYVQTDPPFNLVLTVARHKEIDVQAAVIESAHYKTLMTSDGLAVTTAEFRIRNSRKQFLRLKLPAQTDIWSAFVNGKPEKPAKTKDNGQNTHNDRVVLIKMINSANGFPLKVVYATKIEKFGDSGSFASYLPEPDMVVTNTHWDVYLPERFHYQNLTTNMEKHVSGGHITAGEMADQTIAPLGGPSAGKFTQMLSVSVPTQGVHFSFSKLYANQSDENAWFRIDYVSAEAVYTGQWLGFGAAMLFCFSIIALYLKWISTKIASVGIILAATLISYAAMQHGLSLVSPVLGVGFLISMIVGLLLGKSRITEQLAHFKGRH